MLVFSSPAKLEEDLKQHTGTVESVEDVEKSSKINEEKRKGLPEISELDEDQIDEGQMTEMKDAATWTEVENFNISESLEEETQAPEILTKTEK